MDFNTLNSVLPLEMINKIVYTHKGLTHPTAEMIKPLINEFEWMNGDYKTLDERNKEEEVEEKADEDELISVFDIILIHLFLYL